MAATTEPDWLRLQKKIFTRWVNQKIKKKGMEIKDVTTDLKDPLPLVRLLEVLSEQTFPKKIKPAKMRMQQINNAKEALDWCFGPLKVEMRMKPSPANLVDGAQDPILGMIWAIMLKFMKLGDDEDEGPVLNFKDSLLMWLKNQVKPYKQCPVKNLTKSWHNGMALCALIWKFRPKLMPEFESLTAEDSDKNLNLAFKAANKYFGLEEYLTAADIPKMDEKCMTVYLSEYYYGVAEARKVDLAARRINKLIQFTQINDKLRADFTERADKLVGLFEKVFKVLNDTAIDNTMAGAKARLTQFNKFKKDDKGVGYKLYYESENVYAELALRLSKHERPVWSLDNGRTVPEMKTKLTEMETKEKERNQALHAELSRQIKLAKIYELYTAQYGNSSRWIKEKKAYLTEKTNILSVGAAQAALNTLAAYSDEYKSLKTDVVTLMNSEAKELLDGKFEHSAKVTSCQEETTAGIAELAELEKTKLALHTDDLAREQFKAKVRGWASDHQTAYSKLEIFIKEKQVYLAKKEKVESIADAQLQINILKYYLEEEKTVRPNIAPLKEIGGAILAAEYKTELSQWKFEKPEDITTKEKFVDDGFAANAEAAVKKMAILEDDLARETYKMEIEKKNRTHKDKSAALQRFIAESTTYLDTKEPVSSIAEAEMNLAAHVSYQASQADEEKNTIPAMQAVGVEILSAEYKTDLSEWKFPTPDEVTDRETAVKTSFEKLTETSTKKMLVLEDDLAREQFKAKLRLWNFQHVSLHDKLKAWFEENKAYLEKKEPCNSVADATTNLKVLEAFDKDKKDVTKLQLAAFKKFGADILGAEYKTDLSQWKWETPDEVKGRGEFVDTAWVELDTLAAAKRAVLDLDLKNEIRKEELRVEFAQVATNFSRFAADTINAAKTTQFGLVLEEVEAFGAVLAQKNGVVTTRAATDKKTYETLGTEMTSLEVKENPYTKLTVADLAKSQEDLATAIKELVEAYEKELAKQRRDDKLCKDLAAVVDPFLVNITTSRSKLEEAKAGTQEEDEKLVGEVKAMLAEEKKGTETLASVVAAQAAVDQAGIIFNRHTLNNALDAEVVWSQFCLYLANKKLQLEKEIQNRIMRGVTQEQYDEIKEQWSQFDADKSGTLDKREFKACLYSLGEERGSKEVIAIMEKYGEGKGKDVKIKYEGFKEFMIEQLGDTDTEAEIVDGFKLINRLSETTVDELMDMVLSEADCVYIKSTHADGNYNEWTKSVFAR